MYRHLLGGLLVLTLGSCDHHSTGDPHQSPAEFATLEGPLEGHCEINVIGTGIVDMETDYLPHVVNCENGAAPLEALKAQAVAARSYAYYSIGKNGSIGDSQGSQVYSCGKTPGPQHYEAVNATIGEVVSFEGTQIAAFYVAGKVPSSSDCVALPSDNEPGGSNTEYYVTYNWGKSGANVEQSPLGSLSNYNENRGCKSQNGSSCLANQGWNYKDILHFYYGADVLISSPPSPCQNNVCPPFEQNQCSAQGKTCVLEGGNVVCKEVCIPHCDGALLIDSNCEIEGDCAVFGATCVVNTVGSPECLSSPPACEHKCDGDSIIYSDCTLGDCSAFGATCVEDGGAVQCGPATCEKKCINDTEFQNTDCTIGDCGFFGAYCSEVLGNGPDCVSAFCAESPTAQPEIKEFCWDGKAYFCNAEGKQQEIPLVTEKCDGYDNNCDGTVDEGVKNACGQCGPVPEEVCDGNDNDCDGEVDEGCPVEGQEGAGEDGSGEEGAEEEGAGEEGAEEEGAGDEGAGDEGAGDEGSGEEGAGEEGAGEEGAGDEGAGDEGAGEDGAGEEGAGDEGAEEEGDEENAGDEDDKIGLDNGPEIIITQNDFSEEYDSTLIAEENEAMTDEVQESGCRQSSSDYGWPGVILFVGVLMLWRFRALHNKSPVQ